MVRGVSVAFLTSPMEKPWADSAPLIHAFIPLPEQLILSYFPKGLAPGNTTSYTHPCAQWGHIRIGKTEVEEEGLPSHPQPELPPSTSSSPWVGSLHTPGFPWGGMSLG